jgi:hypothetical protein
MPSRRNQAAEPAGEPIRAQRLPTGRIVGEHVRLVIEGDAAG